MAKLKTKSWRSLIAIFGLLAIIWGVIAWKSYSPVLGLDLQGGISIALTPVDGQPASPDSIDKAIDIIRSRVDALGVAEPDITRQGDNTIIIQIAGIKAEDQTRAFDLIGSTAKLTFRPVIGGPNAAQPSTPVPDCKDRNTWPRDVPSEERVYCFEGAGGGFTKLTLGPTELTGDLLKEASALPPQGNQLSWYVSMTFNNRGSELFANLTGRLAGQGQLAIVLDGEVQSAPNVNEQIRGGEAIIEGIGTEGEAKDLALVLKYGALPVELEASSTETVSPTLGRESLRNGLIASAIGIGVVFFYVLLFYRALGTIIWLGILLHGGITLGLIIILGQVAGFSLSLAGIAGLIVSLGIAADSFIVYFERIKDEVRAGRQVRAAVERAWASARRTIIAADLVTALAALVLYVLAVGNVRGFALMLGLSTTLDLIVSFWFMHPLVYLLGQTRVLKRSRALGARTVAAEGVA